ncbi:MAG: DoxX family protein [Acidobacteria bacterium]|nr:DoxX family protein [Acidobacteriota bacterium]
MIKRTLLLLLLLRFVIGAFWFEHSHQKWEWPETGELQARFARWNEQAEGLQKIYLEKFCIPNWNTLQYLVIFGELTVGLSFLFGWWTRAAAWGGAFMAFNFIFAQGGVNNHELIGNPYGPVLVMGSFAVAYGGGEAQLSISNLLQRQNEILQPQP